MTRPARSVKKKLPVRAIVEPDLYGEWFVSVRGKRRTWTLSDTHGGASAAEALFHAEDCLADLGILGRVRVVNSRPSRAEKNRKAK